MKSGRIVRVTSEQARALPDETDWARLRAEQAAGIEPALDPEEEGIEWDWQNARLVMPQPKRAVSIRMDADVLAFFKAQGRGYQTRMNAVLRAFMDAQKKG